MALAALGLRDAPERVLDMVAAAAPGRLATRAAGGSCTHLTGIPFFVRRAHSSAERSCWQAALYQGSLGTIMVVVRAVAAWA